jgi:osmoprotectant transport system ATP-binding protein
VPSRVEENLMTLDHRATLNDALDAMLTSTHGAALVTGRRDEYLGVIGFDAVTDYIRATEQQHAAEPDTASADQGEGHEHG